MAEQNNDSVLSMLESDLLTELKRKMIGAEDQIEAGLKRLRFEYKPAIISDQEGYTKCRLFPMEIQ